MPTTSAKRRCSWRSPSPEARRSASGTGLRSPAAGRRSARRRCRGGRRAARLPARRRRRRRAARSPRRRRRRAAGTSSASRRPRPASPCSSASAIRRSVQRRSGPSTKAQAPAGVKRTPSTETAPRERSTSGRVSWPANRSFGCAFQPSAARSSYGVAAVDDQLGAAVGRHRLLHAGLLASNSQRQWTCAASARGAAGVLAIRRCVSAPALHPPPPPSGGPASACRSAGAGCSRCWPRRWSSGSSAARWPSLRSRSGIASSGWSTE